MTEPMSGKQTYLPPQILPVPSATTTKKPRQYAHRRLCFCCLEGIILFSRKGLFAVPVSMPKTGARVPTIVSKNNRRSDAMVSERVSYFQSITPAFPEDCFFMFYCDYARE